MDQTEITRRAQDLRARLMELGVAVVSAEYDGYADSGMIETIICRTGENVSARISAELENQLSDLFYDLLETRFPCWEDSCGAFGKFTWNLQTDALHHQHNERFEDYDTSIVDGWGEVPDSPTEPEPATEPATEGR